MKKLLLILIFFSTSAFADSTNVLFIGNSYVFVNDLPVLFKDLSYFGGKNIHAEMEAPGGYTLENHLGTVRTIDAIKRGIWNYVILQEQSQTPVIEYLRYNSMYPSAAKLDSIIKLFNPGAVTVFYMTWGRKNGGQQCIDTSCSPVFTSYFHMQDSVKSSYTIISNTLSALLAPCGEAWRTARLIRPYVNLWDADESHPTLEGSYLNACVFFAKIFNQTPVGLAYNGGLPDSLALFYQQCAWQTVGIKNNISASPDKFELFQNYPNPFNGSTIIKFSIPKTSFVSLKIYNILGKEIATLINENLSSGIYSIPFSNHLIPSGVYFYKLNSNSYSLIKKLVIIK
jgi:hypothetical protein